MSTLDVSKEAHVCTLNYFTSTSTSYTFFFAAQTCIYSRRDARHRIGIHRWVLGYVYSGTDSFRIAHFV